MKRRQGKLSEIRRVVRVLPGNSVFNHQDVSRAGAGGTRQ